MAAQSFKALDPMRDIVSTRQLLHEAIPITGAIVSGTYINDANIKNYSHGMFQSVYDYPYLSSSANHIFDLTVGYASNSSLSGTANKTQQPKKINLYNEMSQVLMGFDYTGSVTQFDEDGDLSAGGAKLKECFFINYARLLNKDEMKKGSFNLELGTNTYANAFAGKRVLLADTDGATEFKVNAAAGEYGILYATNAAGTTLKQSTGFSNKNIKAGLIFYQAGVAVITGSIFASLLSSSVQFGAVTGQDVNEVLTGSAISGACDNFRNRMYNMSFNNTTELNSTVHFCRVDNKDFNYSANPTYLTASKISVKEGVTDPPISYITTVGLYSPDNQLLAVAKLSEPLKKDPTEELVLRVRLDY